jgi:hypothetical protein
VSRDAPSWKLMSEASRVFPAQKGRGATSLISEKRFIQTRPRRGGPGSGQPRVVEVVHVQRGRSPSSDEQLRAAARSVRSEAWLDGDATTPEQPSSAPAPMPVAPKPAQPVVHVMPMWQPSAQQQGVETVAAPDTALAETVPPARRGRRSQSARARAETPRSYADPFAEEDDGANCIRCGYLVEPAREKRGLLTCAGCG